MEAPPLFPRSFAKHYFGELARPTLSPGGVTAILDAQAQMSAIENSVAQPSPPMRPKRSTPDSKPPVIKDTERDKLQGTEAPHSKEFQQVACDTFKSSILFSNPCVVSLVSYHSIILAYTCRAENYCVRFGRHLTKICESFMDQTILNRRTNFRTLAEYVLMSASQSL